MDTQFSEPLLLTRYFYFITPLLLAWVTGWTLGFPETFSSSGIRSRFLVFASVLSTALTLLMFELLTQFDAVLGLYLGIATCFGCLLGLSVLAFFQAHPFNQGLQAAFMLFLSGLTGICYGLGSYALGISLLLLYFITLALGKYASPLQKNRYILYIEYKKDSAIDQAQKILTTFPIKVLDKSYSHQASKQLIIYKYETSSLIQHLIMKRLLRVAGIHHLRLL